MDFSEKTPFPKDPFFRTRLLLYSDTCRKRPFVHILFTIFVPLNPPPNQQNDGFPLQFLLQGPQTELRTLSQNCEQTLQKLRTKRIMNKRAFLIQIQKIEKCNSWKFIIGEFNPGLFAIFTRKRSFALFCARLRSFALFCAHLGVSASACVQSDRVWEPDLSESVSVIILGSPT